MIHRLRLPLASVFAFVLMSGCTSVRLLGNYDETIDRGATNAEKQMDVHLAALARGGDEAVYTPKFYDDLRADLRALRMRAGATPKNDLIVQQFNLALKSVDDLEKIHKGKSPERGFIPEEVEPMQQAFEQLFAAIIKLELAMKRDEPD